LKNKGEKYMADALTNEVKSNETKTPAKDRRLLPGKPVDLEKMDPEQPREREERLLGFTTPRGK
jgi:hypothetical protein